MGLADLFRPRWRHSNTAVRLVSVRQLGNEVSASAQGSDGKIQTLVRVAANDPVAEVRLAAIRALGTCGHEGRCRNVEALESLLVAVDSDDAMKTAVLLYLGIACRERYHHDRRDKALLDRSEQALREVLHVTSHGTEPAQALARTLLDRAHAALVKVEASGGRAAVRIGIRQRGMPEGLEEFTEQAFREAEEEIAEALAEHAKYVDEARDVMMRACQAKCDTETWLDFDSRTRGLKADAVAVGQISIAAGRRCIGR